MAAGNCQRRSLSLAGCVWAIHCRNFPGDCYPFHLSFGTDIFFTWLDFLPLEQLIHKLAMGLDNNIQSASSYIATTSVSHTTGRQ